MTSRGSRSDGCGSSSSVSSSSSDSETIGTDNIEDAKARLRAKIRAQAGSLLSSKGPPVAAVSAIKKTSGGDAPGMRSSSRNVVLPIPVVSSVEPMASDDESMDVAKQQKTGEQSEESRVDSVKDMSDGSGSVSESKRSVVRFDVDDAEKGEAAVPPQDIEEEDKAASPRRPSRELKPSSEVGPVDTKDDDLVDLEAKEEATNSNGAKIGMILLAVTLAIWIIAIPVVITQSNRSEGEDTDVPSVTPPSPPLIPTTAPVLLPTPLALEFPPYSEEALTDPASPQSLALKWMYTDPQAYTYSQERLTQRFALATFYYATQGDNWTMNTNWLDIENQKHECFWYSQVPVCNNEQEFTALELNDNNLVGELPPEVALLTSLTSIHLQQNILGGGIPTTLVELPNLTFLDLQWNLMTEPLPTELGLMATLSYLWLNGTRAHDRNETPTAAIPTELAMLSNLKELHIANNKLDGNIPSEFAMLNNVGWLTLRGNELTGKIPSELSLMPTVSWLDLGENQLSGEIPTTVGWLNETIKVLQLEANALTGTIPDSMNRLTNVQQVWLHENMLTGDVPMGLCYFKRIGKVETIWVDCDQVICSCACLCATPPIDVDGEPGEADDTGDAGLLTVPDLTEVANSTNATKA